MAVAGIHIDFDALLEEALKGVRRAAVFLGLGVNAAADPTFRNYQLTGVSNIQLIPNDLPANTVDHFKEEFRLWIEAGGFRELAESFVNYIDGVHHVCLLIEASQTLVHADDLQERQARFANEGIPNKLNILRQNFGVAPANAEYLVSLSKARNCLTHRRGIVGERDLGEQTTLALSWLGADMFVEEPSGNRIPFNPDTLPIYLPHGGTVLMQMVERKRSFALGEKLLLSARDLAEVCWFYTREASTILQSLLAHAERSGVNVVRKQT